jgi:hypothetical protein
MTNVTGKIRLFLVSYPQKATGDFTVMASVNPNPAPQSLFDDKLMLVQMGMFFSLTFGVMMLAFSSAYISDVETLRSVPNAIWDLACGKPSENGYELPLLMTFGTLSLLSGAVFFAWQRKIAAGRRDADAA